MEELEDDSKPSIPRFTLDNPILPHNRRFLLDILTTRDRIDAPLYILQESVSIKKSVQTEKLLRLSVNSERIYGHLFSPPIHHQYEITHSLDHIDATKILIWNFIRSINESEKFPAWSAIGVDRAREVVNVANTKVIQDMSYWCAQIATLRNKMATLASKKSHQAETLIIDHPYKKFKVIYTATFALWITPGEKPCLSSPDQMDTYITDYDQVCGIVDTAEGRFLTLEASLLYQALSIANMPSPDIIQRVYKWGDNQLIEAGNDGYKVLKTFESILRTVILRNEPYQYCRSFHTRCLGDMKAILTEVNLPMTYYQELCDVLDLVDDLESAELSGIYRHWMHPTVDELAGMKKVKSISTQKKNICYTTVDKVLAAFNRSFILEYIAQNRRWPKVKATAQLRGPLRRWIDKRTLIMDESSSGYHWTDWKNLSFGKEFEFDYKLDLLELMDDKACCLPKDQSHTIFYKKYSQKDRCTSQASRRVLLELLKREEFDTKKIIETICRREIPEPWKVVGLHPKEREMKMDPRLFAILPLEMRAYFVLTEANIAKSLFKYFPQQTMNLNADQLDRRLLLMSEPDLTAKPDKKRFTANLDFKSWNIYWTKEAVEAIFYQMGCLFGMPNLITFTHEFFEMATLFLSSFANPPEKWAGGCFEQSQACDCHLWFGHFGGLEGLRQKGWTIITVAMLEVVKIQSGIDSLITGQGDNQVIIFFIKFPRGLTLTDAQLVEYFTEQIREYIRQIEEVSAGMGQQLKTDETWVSSRIVEYGKDMLVDGVFIPATLKKVSRAFEVTNEIAPGLQSQITHIFSVLQAACSKGLSWLPLYIQALFACHRTVMMYLKFDQANPMRGPIEHDRELMPKILSYILTVPRAIGGLAALPFTEFILRGHPDPVTAALVHTSILERYNPTLPLHMSVLLSGELFSKDVDYLMLATAPDSLNIAQSQTEQNIWKSLVRHSITTTTRNRMFTEIAEAASKKAEEDFVTWMKTITPVFPRFLSLLYSASIFGAMQRVIGSFGNNRTLIFAAGNSSVNISLAKVRKTHTDQWSRVCRVVRSYKNRPMRTLGDTCLSQLAQYLRNRSWKLENEPLGLYGSTVPHPLEQFDIKVNKTGECQPGVPCYGDPYIFFQVHKAPEGKLRCLSRGSSEPYLSGRIRAKREQGLVHTTTLDSPIISAAQLASNRSTVAEPGSNLDKSIVELVKSRTDIDINIVEAMIGKVYGGTLWHRLPDNYTSHVVSLNCRPNISTHVYTSTDTMQHYSRGSTDYTLPFQSIFVLTNSLLSDASARGSLPREQLVMHAHLKCTTCTQEVSPIQLDSMVPWECSDLLTDNPLIKSRTTTLPLSERDLIKPPIRFIDKKKQDYHHRRAAMSHLIVNRYLTNVSVVIRGLTVYRRYKTNLQLRMADIISIQAVPLIDSIACQLLLLSPLLLSWDEIASLNDLASHLLLLINVSGSFIWQNVGQFATLPEFVDSILQHYPHEDPGMDYGRGGSHTFRFLNRILIKRLRRLCKRPKPYACLKSIRLYLSDQNWSQSLHWAQHFIINTWLLSTHGYHKPGVQSILRMPLLPTEEAVAQKVTLCLSHPDFSPVIRVLQDYAPRVREYTPEADSRYNGDRIDPTIASHDPPRATYSASQLPDSCKLNIVKCTVTDSPTTSIPDPCLVRVDPKTRRDHEFKLVGHSSTAMYKWLCVMKHLSLNKSLCMTLGEGAGGIVRGLFELFHADTVIFNSLIGSEGFDPHRLTSFIPAEMRPWIHRVKELEYCREHGGDLLKDDTVRRYSRWSEVDLVTCDAEVSVENKQDRFLLIRNVLKIASSVLKPTGRLIVKSYIFNLSGLVKEIEMLMSRFAECRVFYTVESSFENTEVFIELWGLTSYPKTAYLNQNTIGSLYQLACNRIASDPFQIQFKEVHDKVEQMLMSYRPTNLSYALKIFSNELVDVDTWNKKALKDLQTVIVLFAESRLRTHKNLSFGRTTHGASNQLVGAIVSEKTFLNSLSVWYINLEILARLLDTPDATVWDTRLEDFQPTSLYFNIPPSEMADYEQRYARHFFHILGLAKQLPNA
ncbi:MAG: RNA-dependent RNA polymerase [brine shrimp arlivirus 5]|nr:MAG: RNA-dependent RNA polymerase [brine shrimp arlivirus 5]